MEQRLMAADPWLSQKIVERLYIQPRHLRPRSINAYLLALALVTVATALRVAGADLLPGAQFITLFPAVILTTLLCGMSAGLLAIAASSLCAWYFILPPVFSFDLDPGQGVALLAFVAIASLDVAVVGAMRAAIAHARNLNGTLKTVFDSNPDAIVLINADGQIANANGRAAELFAIPVEELLGAPLESLLPERFRGRHVGHRGNFMTDPRLREMGAGLELSGMRPDGSEFPVDVQIGAIRLKGETFAIATVRDLTRQNALARELAESKQQQAILEERERVADELRLWADAFQCAAIGIEISDPRSGTVHYVNPAYAQAHGIGVDDAKGMAVADFYAEEERARLPALFDKADSLGQVSYESRHRRKDGTTFAVEIEVASKHDAAGAVIYRLTSSRDVSAAKLTEQQLRQAQKMEVVGQLSGGIAHDFNNLLTVIVANTEQLGDELQSRDDLQPMLDDVRHAAQRGAELTKRLLAFSRKQLLRPVVIDCQELLGSMAKMLSRTLRGDIVVRLTSRPDAILAFADHAQLEAAVLNLAVNAQDAMPEGGRLDLGVELAIVEPQNQGDYRGIAPGDYAVISVTDDGEGMTAEVAARAFEPFFTTKEVGKGSGLGLSMAFGFAKQSNGTVTIYSEPGLGTTLRIYLPRVAAKEQQISVPAADAPLPQGCEMVLIVEDDPFVRPAVVRRVESLGYSVVVAASGNEALQKLAANPGIDLLFTDVVMPGGMNGWELAEAARQARPELPIIFTSGYPREVVLEQGSLFEDAVVLTKPYRKAELAVRLRAALAVRSRVA
ncbi:PAS domain S-box protein [Bradyrhizobium sp.]|uniref:PAS domain S-box protein n=1 Tax=Bradyrhizobium sp. TaxID=376 RepID=UPI003C52975F